MSTFDMEFGEVYKVNEGGSGLTPEQEAEIAANTEARHTHQNHEALDLLGTYEADGESDGMPLFNGTPLWTNSHGSVVTDIRQTATGETKIKFRRYADFEMPVEEYTIKTPKATSELENDSGFITAKDIPQGNFSQFIEEISESVNLYQPQPVEAFLDNHSLASSGAIQEATKLNYFLTPQIPVEPNTTYTVTGQQWEKVETALASKAKGRAYTESGEIIGDANSYIEFVQNKDESWTFTTPDTASYILLACYKDPFGQGNTASIDLIAPVFNSSFMIVKGTELPSEYEPFGEVSYRLKDIDIPLNSVNLENIGENGLPIFAPLAGKTIVNFGDSIFGNAQPPNDISTFLAEKLGATVYNCGFGGCRMTTTHTTPEYNAFSMVNLADAIVSGDFTLQNNAVNSTEVTLNNSIKANCARLQTIDFSKVDIITIAYASNDFKGVVLDNEDNPLDTSKFAGALRYSIEKLLTAYPNLRIFVLSAAWRFYIDENNEYTDDSNTYTNNIDLTIKDYNAKLKEVAEEYNLPFVDDYNIGIGKFNRYQYFNANDGAHHKEEGRRLIAEHLAKHLY